MKRSIFGNALEELRKSQKIEGPGSASLLKSHMNYGGSRQHGSRWEYSDKSGCGFAELSPSRTLTGPEFFKLLEQVKGVTKVWWASSKSSQGNPSENHLMQQNIFVASNMGPGSASHPFEFELTRNNHMKVQPGLPFTVTAMFKEPSPDLVPEGWRILCEAVRGKELFPDHVVRYRTKAIDNWKKGRLGSQQRSKKKFDALIQVFEPPKPGSASDVRQLPAVESAPTDVVPAAMQNDAHLPDLASTPNFKTNAPPGSASGSSDVLQQIEN